MTGWALVATIIIAAITGTLTAYLVEAMRETSRTWDAGMDRIVREIDAERLQAHRAGRHSHPGGRGRCLICGKPANRPYDVERDGAL